MSTETIPFEPWQEWWHSAPIWESLAAGAIAGMVVDTVLYPLDTIKTRLQASARASLSTAGLRSGLWRGVGIAVAGGAPCSAVFFVTYESLRGPLCEWSTGAVHASDLSIGFANAVAAAAGEVVASVVRAPVEALKQRTQVGFADARSLTRLYSGWSATLARDLPFATIQYPLYNWLKGLLTSECGPLEPWRAAVIGSVTSSIAAVATTPLDVVKTRRILAPHREQRASVARTLLGLIEQGGVRALFAGAAARALWMGAGGFLFLGSYEQARALLALSRPDDAPPTPSRGERRATDTARLLESNAPSSGPSPYATFASGAAAGFVTDALLHPIDTWKARAIVHLAADASGASLWRGLGWAVLPSVPASGCFFWIYEAARGKLEPGPCRDCAAAGVAEAAASLVRVPAEAFKMQTQTATGSGTPSYRGLSATICLDMAFALLQMPTFETLRGAAARVDGCDGATAGAVAGAASGGLAGALTTPLDVVRTRHVLFGQPGHSFLGTAHALWKAEGPAAFVRGLPQRTAYLSLGGAIYLGIYDACRQHQRT